MKQAIFSQTKTMLETRVYKIILGHCKIKHKYYKKNNSIKNDK